MQYTMVATDTVVGKMSLELTT